MNSPIVITAPAKFAANDKKCMPALYGNRLCTLDEPPAAAKMKRRSICAEQDFKSLITEKSRFSRFVTLSKSGKKIGKFPVCIVVA